MGDELYSYTCCRCSRGRDVLFRLHVSWADVLCIILLHLDRCCESTTLDEKTGQKLFHWMTVLDYFRLHWSKFYSGSLPSESVWKKAIAGHLNVLLEAGSIISNQKGWYGIGPSYVPLQIGRNISSRVTATGRLIPITETSEFVLEKTTRSAIQSSISSISKNRKEIESIDFDRQNPCGEGAVRISCLSTLTHPCLKVSVDRLQGYRTAKATHGAFSGTWYYEVTILDPTSANVRVGWAQGLSDLHAPVGFDEYGYGFSDSKHAVFHTGRPLALFEKCGEQIENIGLLIHLPLPSNEETDYDGLKLKMFQEKYPPRQLSDQYFVRHKLLKGSYLEIFINGASIGRVNEDIGLYRGKYYPAFSVYNGTISLNFGESPFRTSFADDGRDIRPISILAGMQEPFDFETGKFITAETPKIADQCS